MNNFYKNKKSDIIFWVDNKEDQRKILRDFKIKHTI